MKIQLVVEEFYGGLRALKTFIIHARHVGGIIKFIVDSGSPHTIIGTADASRLKIPISSLPSSDLDKPIAGLNNTKLNLKLMKDTKLSFPDESGKTISIEFPVYVNADPVTDLRGQKTQGGPSVLGVDFLLKNNFKLVFDPAKKIAFLERD